MRGKGVVDKIIRGDVEQTKSLRQSKYASGELGKMDPRDWGRGGGMSSHYVWGATASISWRREDVREAERGWPLGAWEWIGLI